MPEWLIARLNPRDLLKALHMLQKIEDARQKQRWDYSICLRESYPRAVSL